MDDNLKKYHQFYKSDKRVKGGQIGICPLCEENKQLVLSHIVPKWTYYWAKQEDRGRIIGEYVSLGVSVIEQDGSKHYLLCEACDQYLGDAENYIKLLMHGLEKEKEKLRITIVRDKHEDLNFELIQRFLFGLTLKAHFATSAPFHKISLQSEQVIEIRNRIKSPKREDLDFPITAMRFESKIAPAIDPKAMMIPSHQKNEKNEELISYLLAGWEWSIFFNKDRWLGQQMILNMRLTCDGTMNIPIGDIVDQRFVNKGRQLTRKGKKTYTKKGQEKMNELLIALVFMQQSPALPS